MNRLVVGLKLVACASVIIAFSVLFMVGYAAVTRADFFRTDSIKITGMSRLTENIILAQAGLKKGDNVLAVNLGVVRKRLLAHPWVADARVAREIPGTIWIEITEHQALAVLDLGRKFLINTNGRVFKEYGPDDPAALPLVTGLAYADISLGEDALSPMMASVVKVLEISQTPDSAVPFSQIRELNMDRQMGVSLTAWEEQHRIKLGFSRYASKYQRIKQLLPFLKHSSKWQGFDAIDANNPDRIVVQMGPSLQKGA